MSASASQPQAAQAACADYDLTYTIAQYLDRHMVLPLLEFLQEKKVYPENDLLQAKIALVAKTKMVDFYSEEFKKLNPSASIPAEMEKLQSEVHVQLKEWKEACGPLIAVVNDQDLCHDLEESGNLTPQHLAKTYQVTDVHIGHLYRFAKLNFDCGRYSDAAHFLHVFRTLSKDDEKRFWALWGKLAADVLMGDSESALEDLNALRAAIENRTSVDAMTQLQQRTWLLHWSMFVFFNIDNGRQSMIEFIMQEKEAKLLNCIQTTCPHLLRYLTCAAIIVNKRRKNVLRDLVRVLTQEKDNYSDPLTSFLRSIYVEFDFDTAHKHLKQCEQLLVSDFFLGHIAGELMEHARQLVFETYARTHQCIDISVLSKRLDLSPGDNEHKLVELIRGARVDVKIDAKNNRLVMDTRYPAVYQQVKDKTETLAARTQQLGFELEKRLAQKDQNKDA